MADGLRPEQLRLRAQQWRQQAQQETKQREVSRLRQLAEALEQEADAIGRFRWQVAANPPIREPSHWGRAKAQETG